MLIDRCGKCFGTILNYLRDGSVTIPESRKECQELIAEAKYYLIDSLVQILERKLSKLDEEYHPLCQVPVITGLDEEHQIVSTSLKVNCIVKKTKNNTKKNINTQYCRPIQCRDGNSNLLNINVVPSLTKVLMGASWFSSVHVNGTIV